MISSWSIFVTTLGDIYIDTGNSYGRVNKWTVNTTMPVPVMYINLTCSDLFIDINNTRYYSIQARHVIVTKSLNINTNLTATVAGSTLSIVYYPDGIFVDINFNLYVVDSINDRIQWSHLGQSITTAVTGNQTSATIVFNGPNGF